MRFLFKTAYEQDIRLFRDGTTAVWYALLTVIVLALRSHRCRCAHLASRQH
jgi:hypothetical protein